MQFTGKAVGFLTWQCCKRWSMLYPAEACTSTCMAYSLSSKLSSGPVYILSWARRCQDLCSISRCSPKCLLEKLLLLPQGEAVSWGYLEIRLVIMDAHCISNSRVGFTWSSASSSAKLGATFVSSRWLFAEAQTQICCLSSASLHCHEIQFNIRLQSCSLMKAYRAFQVSLRILWKVLSQDSMPTDWDSKHILLTAVHHVLQPFVGKDLKFWGLWDPNWAILPAAIGIASHLIAGFSGAFCLHLQWHQQSWLLISAVIFNRRWQPSDELTLPSDIPLVLKRISHIISAIPGDQFPYEISTLRWQIWRRSLPLNEAAAGWAHL